MRPPHRFRPPGLAATLLLGALAAGPAHAMSTTPPEGYRLVWSDEFERDGPPDPAKWVHDTVRNREGWFNHEQQYYARATDDNAWVRNGRLMITARRETRNLAPDWGGQHYTSARLNTRGKGEWTYGFFEVSAKLPCGRGTWPAIWMLGTGGRWPDDGEFDIMEHMGRDPARVSSAIHVAAGHGGQNIGAAFPLPDACTAFHRYQLHWTPEGASFGVDGFTYFRYPRLDAGPRAWPFDRPQFLLLNLAIGGDLGGEVDDTIFPVTMEIDYVRVYQRAPASPAARP